jgi:glycosyltransferase involved in cell wall biosynthesis
LPYKKALLFAGGPLKAVDVELFDLVFVESEINVEDCEREGIPYMKAFGVNTSIFEPINVPVRHDAFLQATFADWKRHTLFAEAVGFRGAVAGRYQEHDTNGYNACLKHRVTIYDELPARDIAYLINASHCVLNTSDFWGGGQRCTLEAMACGVPVIVMSDSPKNCEFVRESGGGIICEPNAQAIREALDKCERDHELGFKGYEYILNNYTEYHYGIRLLKGIESLCA